MAEEEKKQETATAAPDPVSKAPGGAAPGVAAPKLQKIIDDIGKLTVLELSDLVKALEDAFGVSAAAPAFAFAGALPAGGAAASPVEEKTTFNVVLMAAGDKKIQVIKEVRAVTSLGLKEAKDLVESAPATVKENVSKEEAEAIKKKLEAVGAKAELK